VRPRYGTAVATLDDMAIQALDLPDVADGERHGNRT
jgi:hypothetical protein